MQSPLTHYANWLHLRWPAGGVERLPRIGKYGRSKIPGVYITGDLSGVPLLKMALASGAAAVKDAQRVIKNHHGDTDIIVIGGGVSGVAAAIEAKQHGLSVKIIEANQLFATIANFPNGKPIYAYPTDLTPDSTLQVSAAVKEDLLVELREQAAAQELDYVHHSAEKVQAVADKNGNSIHVYLDNGDVLSCKAAVIAIGRSGNFRQLGIPGEDSDKVANRLHDPADFSGKHVLVVGGGDSACETAIAIANLNQTAASTKPHALVTLAYRGSELSRPKAENRAQIVRLAQQGLLNLQFGSQATAIDAASVTLKQKNAEQRLDNDFVFSMIGREAPLDFFRRSGIPIHGESSITSKLLLLVFLLLMTSIYAVKNWIGPFAAVNYSVLNPGTWVAGLAHTFNDQRSLLGTLFHSAQSFGFWVTVAYSSAVVGFGIDRIKRRKTPYVTRQTLTLMAIQVIPLFILPEIILPWLGANDLIPQVIVQHLFPDGSWWRAYGFILAWPLMAWNIFTENPLWWWIIIGFVQTFVIIPFIVWRWGKGAYCGWICSCGALAETMGDRHREKMPHGKVWNKLNFVGQFVLFIAFVMLALISIHWIKPSIINFDYINTYWLKGFWKTGVDWILAGALGTGLYFWFSGRVWCRFACPLAALMHIYARFSKFRIVVEQKKCISCNACTTVCHQGIDIMSFANQGKHMQDPECVRCSACVQTCPTGVLQFGQVDGNECVTAVDSLPASPVLMAEQKHHDQP